VQLPNGSWWEFKFVKVACNVAAPEGEASNQLSDLLRNWFGPNAGLPGTGFVVRFTKEGDIWSASPVSPAGEMPSSAPPETSDRRKPKIVDQVKPKARYTTHVPVYDLTAAAGGWGPDGVPSESGWVKVANEKLTEGMFVAQVVGRSMEPKIADGSWCLFRPCPAGTRNGRLLLIQCQSQFDPEDGGRYTVKKYQSTKVATDEGWMHETVELLPLNPEKTPIRLTTENTVDLRIIGEFVRVLEIP
jgi:SOS-response transcriptional repressor LexA